MKIRRVGAELFHADGRTNRQTEMMKSTVVFRNFTNAPNMVYGFTNNINNVWDVIKLRIKLAIVCIIQRVTERFIISEIFCLSTWHYSKSDVRDMNFTVSGSAT